ncbi:MAG: transcription antitermination factor NusB [Armatimonadota bacterium]|nr:transcription antitermination factor NusB [Armatimonadota bacterium]MCX7777141.1 transcription antitermination factor NusB [Armatimonadota bacterium]MDW8025188.1 transcription antitermination factor NusB [Armatimonadota bacterium]
MRKRHRARRIALQALFQADVGGAPIEEALEFLFQDKQLPKDVIEFATRLALGTWQHRDEIDRVIQECAPHWPIERMANVDRNILRMATYEILHMPDTPHSVSINEAVELAKLFGTSESGRFVNGILGGIVKRHCTPQQESDTENN